LIWKNGSDVLASGSLADPDAGPAAGTLTGAPTAALDGALQPGTSDPTSGTPSSGAAAAEVDAAASSLRPASVISGRGRVWATSPASSAGALRGLTGTVTAPIDASASQHSR
jgi:hypothetical protein